MSWLPMSDFDRELEEQWRSQRGKVAFVDETKADPDADEVSWALGFPVDKEAKPKKNPFLVYDENAEKPEPKSHKKHAVRAIPVTVNHWEVSPEQIRQERKVQH